MDLSIEEAAGVFTDPSAYADEARFYAVCRAAATRVSGGVRGREGLPSVLGADALRRRHGDRARAWRVGQRATARVGRGCEGRVGPRRHAGAHPGADGRAGPHGVSQDQCGVVQAGQRRPARRSRGRAREAVGGPHGGSGRRVRFLHRRRDELPAVHHPGAPRASRGGLPADAETHPGDVRERRPGHGSSDRRRFADREPARVLRVLPGAHRGPSRQPARGPRFGHRERRGRWRADRRARGGGLLRDHRHRGPRHHECRDQWWFRGTCSRTPTSCAS